ncbi:bacteriocin fulvocin C-related protein [Prevotella sp. 10(H)]|uniref:bacteriocin fulvocin C-related protein n=1 Tax=Prevotella sp. 10(H) TaxID=1158294 RepID=UPI0004A720D7|nr:bacteriocin fulvocin C-related protein [Prevotella sp. 10(H)]
MKIKLLSIFIVLCGFGLFSCSGDDEYYSCDPEANEWAKDNLDDIRKMTRSEWLNVDVDLQKVAYLAFTAKQKQVFWLEKTNEIMALGWSDMEAEHLKKAYNFFNNNLDFFDDDIPSEQILKEADIFFYKWSEFAKDRLGWNDNLISSMYMEGYKLLDKEGNMEIAQISTKRLKFYSESSKCDCLTNPTIGQPESCNKNNNKQCMGVQVSICKGKKGCSWAWQTDCDGRCYPLFGL